MKVLSVNAGSSTLKFRLYEMPEEKVVIKGAMERIGIEDSFYSIKIGSEKIKKEVKLTTHLDAVKVLLDLLIEYKIISNLNEINAVGHRIVHGGSLYSDSVVLDNDIIEKLESISSLAPLHNPANIMGVKAFMEAIPGAVQVGCFDTAFHQTMKEEKYLYSIPYELYEKYNIRKYGFHGMSHKFITERMIEILNKKNPNLIICHIGNGASVTAVEEGKSIDTSMGFTPNAGVMMGTRCGDIDYTIIPYLINNTDMDLAAVDNMLNRKSGLEGIAGSSDLRDLDEMFEKNEGKARLVFAMYCGRIVDYIVKYYIELKGNVDAICFTAGGGENDSIIREEVLKKLEPLGIILDKEVNDATMVRKGIENVITKPESTIPVHVLGTDEELMIARDIINLINA